MPYRLVFFGTSDLAVPSLRALLEDPRFEIAGLVTQPDRPVGRHATITPPPVKQVLLDRPDLNIPVQQPEKIKDESFMSWIKDVGPTCDAFVIISYGKILPQWLLDLPRMGIVNIHPSLLPRWRGTSPFQAAIAAGDTMTGVSIMKIDALMDHGPILAVTEEPIHPSDTGKSLHDRLADIGARMLPDVLADYLAGNVEPTEQEHDLATTCGILTREHGRLDFTKTSEELERLVRAYFPWPGTWMEWNGKRLKILEARLGTTTDKQAGEIYTENGDLFLACANGTSLELVKIQEEGKNPVNGSEFGRRRQ